MKVTRPALMQSQNCRGVSRALSGTIGTLQADKTRLETDYIRSAQVSVAIAEEAKLAGYLESIEGALHEIMMEQDVHRAAFWRAFDEFVDPIIARRAAAHG